MKIYDISMPIAEGMPVYKNKPNKQPQIRVVQDFDQAPARESRVDLDVHTGTHVDAPLHMLPEGETMTAIPVEDLVGTCKVFDLTSVEGGITAEHLQPYSIEAGDFVLFKTNNSLKEAFDFSFVYLAASGAEYLVDKQVRGVGIDALGIERDQPGHPTHKTLFQAEILIMEGLRLGEVPEGDYFMVAAPIKLVDTEAAPTRALLLEGVTVQG